MMTIARTIKGTTRSDQRRDVEPDAVAPVIDVAESDPISLDTELA